MANGEVKVTVEVDPEIQARIERANKFAEDMNRNLVEKGILNLTVQVDTMEQAKQIMAWMYSEGYNQDRGKLLQVGWDSTPVNNEVLKKFHELSDSLMANPMPVPLEISTNRSG